MIYIYVLELTKGKWYIGKTNDPSKRFLEHVSENGCSWTHKYAPVQMHDVKPQVSKYDEDNITFDYMEKYGIDNVRGGSYVRIILTPDQLREIDRRLASSKNACFNCNKSGHFIVNCPMKNDESDIYYNIESNLTTDLSTISQKSNDRCFKCGKVGHRIVDCYAKTKVIYNKQANDRCFKCGRVGHEINDCYAKTKVIYQKSAKKQPSTSGHCFKCGRVGHFGSNCYAKTNVW